MMVFVTHNLPELSDRYGAVAVKDFVHQLGVTSVRVPPNGWQTQAQLDIMQFVVTAHKEEEEDGEVLAFAHCSLLLVCTAHTTHC